MCVLDVSVLTSSAVDNILLDSTPVLELITTITYPLVCDDIVQLTLIVVSFQIYVITLYGGPLGTR